MKDIDALLEELKAKRKKYRFTKLLNICELYFGKYHTSGSHHVFKTPWKGDPRINLQESKGGKAKPYQVDQVVEALKKLKEGKEPHG